MSATIDASQLTKITQAFAKAAANISKVGAAFLQAEGDPIVKQYHDTVPVRTGRLRDSIHGSNISPTEYKGGSTVIYAPIVERRRGNLKTAFDTGSAKIKADLPNLSKQILESSS